MSFNQPILNEMMARESIEYRARDLEAARRNHLARASKRRPRTGRRFSLSRIRLAVRKPA